MNENERVWWVLRGEARRQPTLDVVVGNHRRRPGVVGRHLRGDGLPGKGGGGWAGGGGAS